MPYKVTDFGTNQKPVSDFLLMIYTKLYPIYHRFQVIADYWSNLHFYTLIVVNPYTHNHKIWPL